MTNMENKIELRFADSVWHRVVQIVQEAMITGVDCADLMRQIRVVVSDDENNTLVLSDSYEKQVREMHEKMLSHARELQALQPNNKFIITDGEGSN